MNGTIKVEGQEGILAAVPAILGFHPQDSLCVVSLQGQRHQVGPVMRVDLAGLAVGHLGRVVDMVQRYADAVVLVVYAGPEVRYDVGPVARMLAEHVPVLEVVEVGNDPQPGDPDLTAANAMIGRATLSGRAQVVASIAYGSPDPKSPPPRFWSTVAERDMMLAQFLQDAAASLPGLIFALTQTRDDDPQLPDLAAATAIVAYRSGDGVLAQVCLDRVLRVAPQHRLSQLVSAVLDTGVPPADLDGLMQDL